MSAAEKSGEQNVLSLRTPLASAPRIGYLAHQSHRGNPDNFLCASNLPRKKIKRAAVLTPVVFTAALISLVIGPLLPTLENSRQAQRTANATADLLALNSAELTYSNAHSAFTTNLALLPFPAAQHGFNFSVRSNGGWLATATDAQLTALGVTGTNSFQISLGAGHAVLTNTVPGAADARRAAMDRIVTNGLGALQAIFATNAAARTQAVAVASSLVQTYDLFAALDPNGDGSVSYAELLAANTATNANLAAFLNTLSNQLALGSSGEIISNLTGARFSDVANNNLTTALPTLLNFTNAPSTNWPLRGIVYSRTNSIGVPTVYLCAADGSTDRVLLSNATWPRLSPDGRWLAYHYMNVPTAHPRTQQVRVHDLLKGDDAQSDTVILAPIETYLYDFTADNSAVVLDYGGMVWRPRDNFQPLQVIFNSPLLQGPARNPVTGQFIGANILNSSQRLRLFNFNPANTNLPPNVRDVPNSISNDRWPTWSADGQWIAAYNFNDALTDEYWFKIRPDGSQRTRLSFLPNFSVTSHPNAAWTPDGQFLVVIATVGGTNGLWALATDGSGALQLLKSGYAPGAGTSYDFVGAATVNLPFAPPVALAQNFAANTNVALASYAVSNATLNLRATASAFAKVLLPGDPCRGLYLAADPGAGITLRSADGSSAISAANVELADKLSALHSRFRGVGRINGNLFNLGGLVSLPGEPVMPVTAVAWPLDPALPGDAPATNQALWPGGALNSAAQTAADSGFTPPSPAFPGDPARVLTVAGNYFGSSLFSVEPLGSVEG